MGRMDVKRKLNKGRGMEFVIPLQPKCYLRQQARYKPHNGNKETFQDYNLAASIYLPPLEIDFPVNIKAHFYVPRYKYNIIGLMEGLQKCMYSAGMIADKKWDMVAGWDGTRVYKDPDYPRTEVWITPMD